MTLLKYKLLEIKLNLGFNNLSLIHLIQLLCELFFLSFARDLYRT